MKTKKSVEGTSVPTGFRKNSAHFRQNRKKTSFRDKVSFQISSEKVPPRKFSSALFSRCPGQTNPAFAAVLLTSIALKLHSEQRPISATRFPKVISPADITN